MSTALDTARALPRTAPTPWGRWGLRAVVVGYLGMAIVVPLAAVLAHGFRDGLAAFWGELTSPTAFDALKLTLAVAAIMTVVNTVMGTLTAYVLVRYDFPGRRWFDGLIDMPFAIPTLVTGVMLVVLYGPQGAMGGWLEARGISVIYSPGRASCWLCSSSRTRS